MTLWEGVFSLRRGPSLKPDRPAPPPEVYDDDEHHGQGPIGADLPDPEPERPAEP